LKLQLHSLEVHGPNPDFTRAFQAAAKEHVDALITVRTALLIRYGKQIAELVIKHRLPSVWEGSDFVEAGGLMSYSASDAEVFRRAAYFVDMILKGKLHAEIPIEQPTKLSW
jgi:putative ABC transport system substrate-binding protein